MFYKQRVLFQGDSITDCGRNGSDFYDVGKGYPYLAKAEIEFEHGGDFEIINRDVSGNRIVDLIARIKFDIINLKPDYISILIGVNDVWHEIVSENGLIRRILNFIMTALLQLLRRSFRILKLQLWNPLFWKVPPPVIPKKFPIN